MQGVLLSHSCTASHSILPHHRGLQDDSCTDLRNVTLFLLAVAHLFQTWLVYSLFKIHLLGSLPKKSCFCCITPILSDLHWLPVRHKINFKIATITFKVLQFQQLSDLTALIPRYVPTSSPKLQHLKNDLCRVMQSRVPTKGLSHSACLRHVAA